MHSFCCLRAESTSHISILTPANHFLLCEILSVSLWVENVSHLPCFGMLWQLFFNITRSLKELLAVLGGNSGLVILREWGAFMCALSGLCVNGMFKIWISQGCFYTRTSNLTLLKVSLRWETLFLSSATLSDSLFLSCRMSVTRLSFCAAHLLLF